MAFSFSLKDRTVQSGVRRVAHEQCDQALRQLAADLASEPATVHGLRKSAKKLRGLLRLIRPVLDCARSDNAAIRDAAGRIAELRDAEVMRQTFDGLVDRLPAKAHEPIRSALDSRLQAASHPDALAEAIDGMRHEFTAVQQRIDSWKLSAKGFDALEPGLSATWGRSRKGLQRARTAGADPELPAAPFHAWRKQVKYHWYQARLLEPIWPEMMAPHITQVDLLAELLGEHNDLDVLLTTLSEDPGLAEGTVLKPIRKEVLARRTDKAAQAVPLGARLFADPPDAMAERWRRWWHLWGGK